MVIDMDFDVALEKIKQICSSGSKQCVQEVVDFLQNYFLHYSWVGIYVVKEDMLKLGPWCGPEETEHVSIPIGEGVCGSAAKSGKTEIVDNVHEDERYLSCFLSTVSEIVVPIKDVQGKVVGEIDIDSDVVAAFKNEDKLFLERVAEMLASHVG